MQYGLEAFCPTRHLKKEDEKMANVEESLQFIVLEFDKNEKRIMVSHSKMWEIMKEDEKEAERQTRNAEREATQKTVKTVQAKVEKATLGDIGALADLKRKLDGGN
jgi:small subunit ribosomal protein S1